MNPTMDPAEEGARLLAEGQPAAAARLLAGVLQRDPSHLGALHNLAGALQSLGDLASAEVLYRRLLATGRAGAGSWVDYGLLLLRLDRPREAQAALRTALPGQAEDLHLQGLLAQAALAAGAWQEALPHLQTCIDQDPDPAERAWNRAALNLLSGQWQAGWAGFEARWGSRLRRTPLPAFDAPRWRGEPLENGTLLLWAEQGLGDTLLAMRHLPHVLERCGHVVLALPRPLLPLVPPLPGLQVVEDALPLPSFTCHLPLLSLPGLLNYVPEADGGGAYLQPPPADGWAEVLRERLRALPPGLRVGLVWRGGDSFPGNAARSLPERDVPSLLATPGIQWVSLQAGTPAPWPVALDLGPELTDFGHTAQALSALDHVITVDTATANLAGALGLEAWVLLHLACDWRWMLGGGRTPWYPSLQLFRQRRSGDWREVIQAVQSALAARGT